MSMPDQILLDIIEEHLSYEIDMLRGLYRLFGKVDQAWNEHEKKVQYYAQINSFCLHARSLLDFFADKRRDQTDAIASDFTSGYTPTFDQTKEPLKSLRTKLNKQIFHLTRDRTIIAAQKFQPDTDAQELLKIIEPAIAHFTDCLTQDFKHFKCFFSPVDFLIVPPKASATNAFTTESFTVVSGPKSCG
jgi:hypothetical protein